MKQTMTYLVPDISSGHCRAAIEAEVGAVAGVEAVGIDFRQTQGGDCRESKPSDGLEPSTPCLLKKGRGSPDWIVRRLVVVGGVVAGGERCSSLYRLLGGGRGWIGAR